MAAAMIDLTETSSDEEDAPVRKLSPPSLRAEHVNGVAKKFGIGDEISVGGRVTASPAPTAGASMGATSVPSNGAGRNGGPGSAEKGEPQDGRSKAVWKGMGMGKTDAATTPLEEVNTTASLSGWGDPLPPEPPTPHSRLQDNNRSTENGVDGASVPISIPSSQPTLNIVKREMVSSDGDVERTQRGRASPSSPPVPTPPAAAPAPPGVDDSGGFRQFWRAGDYEAHPTGVRSVQGAMDHVRVHPKFLHSNATSHKWALGAVAELLDNAIDEVNNGATFVSVDKIVNPRDSCPALLVQDDGGGMAPDTMRACMSLGYSRKNTNTTIGQYGNGFKTSTMRLGADVVVFSRHIEQGNVTQSIGLLSYTFLRKTGREDVVVPMIDYEVPQNGAPPEKVIRSSLDDWVRNLSTIMQWSPYATEAELLDQFSGMGSHGTKVIVYNLWFNDDGVLELDFDTDETDIQLRGGGEKNEKAGKGGHVNLAEQHIANRYHHSLRVYTSILYLVMPPGFEIILRGKPVEHHSISNDLKFPESIVYKPQIGDEKNFTAQVITFIGFTKEAPLINVHGFNVYHKNRLIMPFWKVWQENSSRGRGVVGVLEANFVEPAHDKQDFERTAVLLRLETRLKQMTVEYWNLHCHLIGYQPNTKAGKAARKLATPSIEYPAPLLSHPPDGIRRSGSPSPSSEGHVKTEAGEVPRNSSRRAASGTAEVVEKYKRQRMESNGGAQANATPSTETGGNTETALVEHAPENEAMIIDLIQENTHLRARIVDYEFDVRKLMSRVVELEKELQGAQMNNVNLQSQLQKPGQPNTSRPRLEVKTEE